MASVAPTVDELFPAMSSPPRSDICWVSCATKVVRRWKQMQVSHYGGKYSIQRFLALEEYAKNTSALRVFLVCAGTPLPMVALVFAQEAIPLQDPSADWSANYGLWIRVVVLVWVVVNVLMIQGSYFFEFHVTARQVLLVSTCVSIGVLAATMTAAAYLIFPIPFFILTTIPAFYAILIVSFQLVIGRTGVSQLVASRDQVVEFIKSVGAETSPVGIFPVYELLFRAAEGTPYQLPVILVLPLIKLLAKNVVLRYTRMREDMVPLEVIFTVDFFNALYVSTCMQSATSMAGVVTITITDLAQTIVMFYGLKRRTDNILTRLDEVVAPSATVNDNSIFTMLHALCCNRENYENQSRLGIRKLSSLRFQLSQVNQSVLDSLDAIPIQATAEYSEVPVKTNVATWCCCFIRSIQPFTSRDAVQVRSAASERLLAFERRKSSRLMLTKHPTILREALETLFTTECIILTAYLEAFIPFFYSSYMLVMVHFPSAWYHTEMAAITQTNVLSTVTPLLVFGLLQIATLTVLTTFIRRNCEMSALHQLAFVLDTQMPMVQCKLILWMVITLCFRVKHFGVDFTFEFIRLGFPRLWSPP